MRPDVDPTEVVQVVVHGAFFDHLAEWLEGQGFTLEEIPVEGDLRTIMVGIGDERWRRAGTIE